MRFNVNGKDIKIHNARIKSITTGMEQRLVNRVKLEFDSTKELNQYEKTKIKAAIESAINQNAEPTSKAFARFITKSIASHLSELQLDLPSIVYEDIECTLMKGNFTEVETFVRNYIQNNCQNKMDAEPVVHAHWKMKIVKTGYWYECSNCGSPWSINGMTHECEQTPYCSYCGAKMDEETE